MFADFFFCAKGTGGQFGQSQHHAVNAIPCYSDEMDKVWPAAAMNLTYVCHGMFFGKR